MMRNQLLKVYHALGFKHSSSNPQTIGYSSNVKNERISSMVIPEPCELNISEPNPENANYEEWLVDHPSAMKSFEEIMSIAEGKKIVVFLDYDGTLSPIVEDPELAFMSDTMRSAVREVASYFPTAIISGRSRNKVYDFVQLDNVYYAGSHGMDIMTRRQKSGDRKGNEAIIFQPAKEFLPEIQKIYKELEEEVKEIEGVTVEDNRFCISVHFRRANEKDYPLVEERVEVVLARHSRFRLTRGRKVLEIRPCISWNKGNAVEYLLETLGLSESNDVVPIYIGDDTTDEDAFKVIHNRGHGFPILVSKKPKETKASYSLHDPSQVLLFLVRLARWGRDSLTSI
ncbi:putative trehalose-phosphate phosphatase D [Silene latifolia]|uniref:putative trehalose-phosphate phosphatase D n=1 Tax=Silene latifolia TaxID=37657 RepID=UPI003D788ABD